MHFRLLKDLVHIPEYNLLHIRMVEDSSIGVRGKSGLWGGRFGIIQDNIWIQDLAGG